MENEVPTIHFISGLGADKLAFSFLNIQSPFRKNYAEWIMPGDKESMIDYVKRMIEIYQIKEGDILIGLSFGGMVSIEINKLVRARLMILLSSTATTFGLSPIIRIIGGLELTKLIPKKQLIQSNASAHFAFGAKTDDEKEKLDLFIQRGDADLNAWSINQLVKWRNDKKPENAIVINGDKDKIFPVKKSRPDYVIEGGTHLMVFNKAAEISVIVNQLLDQAK